MTAVADPLHGLGQMLGHDFIRHGFLAGTFVALAAGLVGYFVVLRNQVFTGEALGHVAFTGALGALAVGADPLLGLFSTTVVGALGIGALGGRGRGSDVVVGTVVSWVLGLGVLFLSVYTTSRSSGNGAVGVSVLFGSVYGLSLRQAAVAAAIGTACAVAVAAIARPLLFASVAPDVAAARGVPARALGLAFLALLGLTVAEAVQAVGALLVLALLVTPAATAQRLTANPYAGLALSGLLGVADVWAGLTLSYVFQSIPPSFLVVALAFATQVAVTFATSAAQRRGRRAAVS